MLTGTLFPMYAWGFMPLIRTRQDCRKGVVYAPALVTPAHRTR